MVGAEAALKPPSYFVMSFFASMLIVKNNFRNGNGLRLRCFSLTGKHKSDKNRMTPEWRNWQTRWTQNPSLSCKQ